MLTVLSAKGNKIRNPLLFCWKQKYLVWKSTRNWFCSNSGHFKLFELGIFCCKNVKVTAPYGLKPAIKIEFCYWLRWKSVTFAPHSSLYLHSSISPVTAVFLIGLKWLAVTVISCILIRTFREFLYSLARKTRSRCRCAPRNHRRLKQSKRSRKSRWVEWAGGEGHKNKTWKKMKRRLRGEVGEVISDCTIFTDYFRFSHFRQRSSKTQRREIISR